LIAAIVQKSGAKNSCAAAKMRTSAAFKLPKSLVAIAIEHDRNAAYPYLAS
jgi:hypothetical protein